MGWKRRNYDTLDFDNPEYRMHRIKDEGEEQRNIRLCDLLHSDHNHVSMNDCVSMSSSLSPISADVLLAHIRAS